MEDVVPTNVNPSPPPTQFGNTLGFNPQVGILETPEPPVLPVEHSLDSRISTSPPPRRLCSKLIPSQLHISQSIPDQLQSDPSHSLIELQPKMASECEKGEEVEQMEEVEEVEPVEEMEEVEQVEQVTEQVKPVEEVEEVEQMDVMENEQDEGLEEEEDVPEELCKVSGPSALMSPRPPNSDREFVLTGGGDLEFILTGGGMDGEDRDCELDWRGGSSKGFRCRSRYY